MSGSIRGEDGAPGRRTPGPAYHLPHGRRREAATRLPGSPPRLHGYTHCGFNALITAFGSKMFLLAMLAFGKRSVFKDQHGNCGPTTLFNSFSTVCGLTAPIMRGSNYCGRTVCFGGVNSQGLS
jgi:hypothetical protein